MNMGQVFMNVSMNKLISLEVVGGPPSILQSFVSLAKDMHTIIIYTFTHGRSRLSFQSYIKWHCYLFMSPLFHTEARQHEDFPQIFQQVTIFTHSSVKAAITMLETFPVVFLHVDLASKWKQSPVTCTKKTCVKRMTCYFIKYTQGGKYKLTEVYVCDVTQ